MASLSSSVRVASGLTLSYAAQGERSAPRVVLLPGPTDSWRSYAPVLEHLPGSLRAIALSQRGHGDSDKPETGYAVNDFARDTIDVLDALDIERAVLCGHSGSCLVARRVAIDNPERVVGLVLEASPLTLKDDPALQSFVDTVVSSLSDPLDPAFARSFITDTSSPSVDPRTVDDLVADLVKVPARVWQEMFSGLLTYDDTSQLEQIAAPTMLVWGDRDPLVGRDAQDVLTERLPHAELAEYRGIGHTPRWEEPARFARDVATFVARTR